MAPKKTEEAAPLESNGMTPFQEALVKELHGIGVALVALLASKPAVPQEVTQARLTAAEASTKEVGKTDPPPRDAEVKQAAQVLRAQEVIKPEGRVFTIEDINALIQDAVKRNVVTVPAIQKVLQEMNVKRISELAPDSFETFLKAVGL